MSAAFVLLGLVVGAATCAAIALVTARVLGLDRLAWRGPAPKFRTDLVLGALGLVGLLGSLFLLFEGSELLGLSRIGAALAILVCSAGVVLAIRPAADQPAGARSSREEARRSRAA
jgi:drug/metabolite transporter (DMT)-like permease